jgi:nucleotide-binding universal stress UspA family protein
MSDIPEQNEIHTDDAPTASTATEPSQDAHEGRHRRQRIVVGVDGSASSLGAFRAAIRMARSTDSDLLAIAAWKYPSAYGGYPPPDWSPESDVREVLADATASVFEGDVPAWFTSDVREGAPVRVLLEASHGASMLIVGSRGHGGFSGLLLGSVSSTCAEYAKCPVLVHHEPPESE